MIASLNMRPATVAERGALEALQWRASLMWEEYRDALLAHPDAIELPVEQIARTIVAELKDKAVGFAVVLPRRDGDADLDGLFVEPAVWRAGIGTRLIREAEIFAAAEGADFLCVVGNPRAEGFYAACGFKLIGREATRFGIGLTMRKAIGGAGRGDG
jgi:GNAT superfamily N-acetyltransferase